MSIDRLLGYINEFPTSEYWTEKRMTSVIKDLDDHMTNVKMSQKFMREKLALLKVKNFLQLDHKGKLLSVVCDGKTITVSFITGSGMSEDRAILGKLGFKWQKVKLEFSRKCNGVNVDAVREFIKRVESSHV